MSGIGGQRRKTCLVTSVVCVFALCLVGCGADSEASRLGKSVTGVLHGDARADCEPLAASGSWSCVIEDDPGSGSSRILIVRVDRRDCWRGAPTSRRYEIEGCLEGL